MKTVLLSFFYFDDVCIHIFVKATPIFFFGYYNIKHVFYTSQLFQKAINKKNLPRFKVNENNFFTGTRTTINDGMFLKKKKICPRMFGFIQPAC